MLKTLFALNILKFLSRLEKQPDQNAKFKFKFYDAAYCTANNYNTHTAQYLKNIGNQAMKFTQLI